VGRSQGKRPLGKHKLRWEEYNKIVFNVKGYGLIHLAVGREKWRAVINTEI
jgi:hypothetical protein